MNRHSSAQGFSMLELLIGASVGILLVGGLLYLFVQTSGHNKTQTKMARLSNELRTTMEIMANDIRRSGYWASAANDVGTNVNTNPFMVTGTTDLSINAGADCILFSYDYNKNGTIPAVNTASDDERYGYRFINGKIQTRPYDAAFNCAAAENAWENLTDPAATTVTQLSFTLSSHTISVGGTSTILQRGVTISIAGYVPGETDLRMNLTRTVKIRNDKYTP